jgi:hypothetical protein
MSLRGVRQERASTAVDVRQCLVTVRKGTHFAFPAEIVRGLGSTSEVRRPAAGNAHTHLPRTDLLCHFPGTAASGAPAREVLCGHQVPQQAVLVDEVIGLTEVSKEQIRPLPAHFTGPERVWFSGLFLFRDTVALVVNPEWLLVQGERLPSDPRLTIGPAPDRSERESLERSGTNQGTGADDSSSVGSDATDELALEEATDAEDTPWAEL